MKIRFFDEDFSVCRLHSLEGVDLTADIFFMARTPDEVSFICPTAKAPANASKANHGWRMFRIEGTLDFSLVGILSSISRVLAASGIPIVAASTYDTDYILINRDKEALAREALQGAGYEIVP